MIAALLEMHANTMPGPRFDGLTPALLRCLLGHEVWSASGVFPTIGS